jgi:signal transduction histidine kinase
MQIKIMAVDDEPKLERLIRQLFRREIRRQELGFSFAENGQEALELLRSDPKIDVVLTDINMPQMDGLTLLKKLKELKGTLNPVLTSIIVSAYNDMGNIRRAMNAGAFDFVTKPLDLNDLRATLEKTVKHIQFLKKIIAQKELAQLALRRANEELEQRVQERTAELMQANQALKASNAELDAFSHTVAHDLKNPIAGILMSADMIIENFAELEEEELLEFVEFIQRSGDKAKTIIEELLLLSGIRKAEVILEALNMAEILAEVESRLRPMIKKYEAELIIPLTWPVVVGHAPWIEQVWFNYLSNGIKYGGSPPRLELGASKMHEAIRFWLRDNGAGIAKEAQASLFSEFTRLDTAEIEGTGLGLSIVKRIVNKLGGQVGVESNIGQGSEFYFTLPTVKT